MNFRLVRSDVSLLLSFWDLVGAAVTSVSVVTCELASFLLRQWTQAHAFARPGQMSTHTETDRHVDAHILDTQLEDPSRDVMSTYTTT